jgi:hypothetical protein
VGAGHAVGSVVQTLSAPGWPEMPPGERTTSGSQYIRGCARMNAISGKEFQGPPWPEVQRAGRHSFTRAGVEKPPHMN